MVYRSTKKDGFAGTFCEGTKYSDVAIIRVGGSGASKERVIASGQFLIDAGYTVLFLGYFLWENQTDIINEIPVDYVEKAIFWLKEKINNPNLKIGMTGISQGAQYTLLAASLISDITCIAVASPFDYVMEGNTSSFKGTGHSSFTWHGTELCYSEWKLLRTNRLCLFLKILKDKDYGLSRIMRYGYDKNGVDESSRIQVEKMNAHVLLLASKDDDCWPADEAVPRIVNRLKQVDYSYLVESYIYQKGCHNMGGNMDIDSKQGKKLKKLMRSWSEHPEECVKCIEDSKFRILEFFRKTLY